jgi:hypothetical protein
MSCSTPVHAIAHGETILEGLDVDVRRAHVERVGDEDAHEPDHRRFRGKVLQLLDVGIEVEVVHARLDVADDLALRGLAGAIQALERGFELAWNRHHRLHRAPGHHLKCADGVSVGGVRHRERHLGIVLAQREHACLAQESRRHALLEDRELGIARRIDERQRKLLGKRVGDVALRYDAKRHEKRAQALLRLLLEAKGALERRLVELAALDQDLAKSLANGGVHFKAVDYSRKSS